MKLIRIIESVVSWEPIVISLASHLPGLLWDKGFSKHRNMKYVGFELVVNCNPIGMKM
jgi:hypothetical protein